jgi:hypothetical protein
MAALSRCGWPQISRASRGVVTDIILAPWDVQFDGRWDNQLPYCIAGQVSVASGNPQKQP